MATLSTSSTHDQELAVEELFEQLRHIEGKAEIVDGRIVLMSPTGAWPSLAALKIATSLLTYVRRARRGLAVADNATFQVDLPHRTSFSPDAAYYEGPPAKMGPFPQAPRFAVEVRSLGDYGPRAERQQAEKREDYFAAGTLVVWDVDLLSNDVIRSYASSAPNEPVIFRPADTAHAEPAVPGWTVSVQELLPDDWEPPTVP